MWCEVVMLPNLLQGNNSLSNALNTGCASGSLASLNASILPGGATGPLTTLGIGRTSGQMTTQGTVPIIPGISVPNKDMRVSQPQSGGGNHKIDTTNHYHIFVGDLAPEIEAHHLKEVFCMFGTVTECKIIKDMHTQKPKGYGFVAYAIKEEAEDAINKMNGQILGTRTIRTNWAIRKPTPIPAKDQKPLNYMEVYQASSASNSTVYVGGIQDPSEEMLREAFVDYGEILEVRIFKEKGYAFIRFDTHEGATRAIITMHGKDVGGQPCKCSWGKENNEEKEGSLVNSPALLTPYASLYTTTPALGYGTVNGASPLAYVHPQINYANYAATIQKLAAANMLNNYALIQQSGLTHSPATLHQVPQVQTLNNSSTFAINPHTLLSNGFSTTNNTNSHSTLNAAVSLLAANSAANSSMDMTTGLRF